MPESPSFDPMAIWRDLVSQWEKGTNEFANQTMASDPFRQGMHGGMNASLAAQKAIGELMARYLGTLNLPTRDDIQALGAQLQHIDDHLARIARLIEGGAGGEGGGEAAPPLAAPPPVARPARTKRPLVAVAPPPAPPAPPSAPAKRARSRKS